MAGAPLSVNGEYNPQTAAYLEAVTPTMVEEVRRLLRRAARSGGGGGGGGGSTTTMTTTRGDNDDDDDDDEYPPPPVHAKSQRWGNAFPSQPMKVDADDDDDDETKTATAAMTSGDDECARAAFPPGSGSGAFVWDGACGFAACGDFVAGAGVESAFLSGRGAGIAIADALSPPPPPPTT